MIGDSDEEKEDNDDDDDSWTEVWNIKYEIKEGTLKERKFSLNLSWSWSTNTEKISIVRSRKGFSGFKNCWSILAELQIISFSPLWMMTLLIDSNKSMNSFLIFYYYDIHTHRHHHHRQYYPYIILILIITKPTLSLSLSWLSSPNTQSIIIK